MHEAQLDCTLPGCKYIPTTIKTHLMPPECFLDNFYFLAEMTVKAVILAGGDTLGTRFRPLTMDFHKCLFAVAGRPILSHIIAKLVDDLAHDLKEVFLLSFFQDTAPFDEYIRSAQQEFSGLKISLLTEPSPLGTGGGLCYFKEKIVTQGQDSQILLIHGDIACGYPFRPLLDFHLSRRATVTILGISPHKLLEDKLLQKEEKEKIMGNYGTIFYDKDSKEVVHYVEKPKSAMFAKFKPPKTNYHVSFNGGVYAFSDSIFDLLQDAKARKIASPPPEYCLPGEKPASASCALSFEYDIFKALPGCENVAFFTYEHSAPWFQLTTPRFALAANSFFLGCKYANPTMMSGIISPVEIQSVSQFDRCQIGPDVTVGKNVIIGLGVRLKNCIICDNVTIGDHSVIINAIVSTDVRIGMWCRVEGNLDNQVHAGESRRNTFSNRLAILCKGTKVDNMAMVYNSMVLPYKRLLGDVKYEIVM